MATAESKTTLEHKVGPKSAEDWPKFRYGSKDLRPALHQLYEIITKLDQWKCMVEMPPCGYSDAYLYDGNIESISQQFKLAQNGYVDRAAWCLLMRCMHYIALYGWDNLETWARKNERFDIVTPVEPVASTPPTLPVSTPSEKVTLWVLPSRVREEMN